MIDHIGLDVSHLQKSKDFFAHALKPLGYGVFMQWEEWVGFAVGGEKGKPDFWIGSGKPTGQSVHIAFRANTRKEVDAFYKAALEMGGTDNGPPGIRAQYHPRYYGAFVYDPDGHNIEAVCHEEE